MSTVNVSLKNSRVRCGFSPPGRGQFRGMGRPVVVIPTYNEAAFIGKTIELIQSAWTDPHIIVVDDGSRDDSGQIAHSKGCEVIRLPKNRGKSHAFFSAIPSIALRRPQSLITIDADLMRMGPLDLQTLVGSTSGSTITGEINMVIAKVFERFDHEDIDEVPPGFSGVRSFSWPAIQCLSHIPGPMLPRRYGLEPFFGYFFESHASYTGHTRFVFRECYGNESAFPNGRREGEPKQFADYSYETDRADEIRSLFSKIVGELRLDL